MSEPIDPSDVVLRDKSAAISLTLLAAGKMVCKMDKTEEKLRLTKQEKNGKNKEIKIKLKECYFIVK